METLQSSADIAIRAKAWRLCWMARSHVAAQSSRKTQNVMREFSNRNQEGGNRNQRTKKGYWMNRVFAAFIANDLSGPSSKEMENP